MSRALEGGAVHAVRGMGWVAARLRAGPIPALRSLWHGPSLRRTDGAWMRCCERCERPKGARNAAWGRRRRMPPGHACCPSRQGSRRVRPLPPRQARPRAYRSRHGGGAGPACCAQAFRASFRRKKRASPHRPARYVGPPARTSRQRFGGPQPSKVHSYRPASPGGRGVCALGRTHSLRRPPPGEAGGKAAGEVGGRRNPRRKRSAQAELFRRALTAFLPAPR